MNPGQFIGMIVQPDLLDAATREGLDEIIREYPFCQPAQLLYLKSLQVEGSVRFNKQLKLAAIYAGNRKALFELLEVAKHPSPPPERVFQVEVAEQMIGPAEIILSANELPDQEFMPFDLVPFSETIPDSQSDALKSAYISQLERFVPIYPVDLLSFDFSPGQSDMPDSLPYDSATNETSRPLGHGLRMEQGELAEFQFEDAISAGTARESLPKKDQSELIERFISATSSKVIKPDMPPVSEEDRSLASLREDEEILTETLARIYIRQGYFMKAIMAYEKLSLKYPEKSIYFASQIEMVRELIKNQ